MFCMHNNNALAPLKDTWCVCLELLGRSWKVDWKTFSHVMILPHEILHSVIVNSSTQVNGALQWLELGDITKLDTLLW